MSKHTPAPWSVPHMARNEISCNCAYVLAEPWMGSICTISVSDGKSISELGNDCPPLEEAQANARLIAAAPELLSALKDIIGWVPGAAAWHTDAPIKAVERARAAIDKATRAD